MRYIDAMCKSLVIIILQEEINQYTLCEGKSNHKNINNPSIITKIASICFNLVHKRVPLMPTN